MDNNILGWCDYICCDTATEEKCYDAWDDNSGTPITSCAAFADGGCPCPEGTERCGAGKVLFSTQANYRTLIAYAIFSFSNQSDLDNNIVGWCDFICCDTATEEMCYDAWDDNSTSCAAFVDGGCPCPEGTERCGAGKVLFSTQANYRTLIAYMFVPYSPSRIDQTWTTTSSVGVQVFAVTRPQKYCAIIGMKWVTTTNFAPLSSMEVDVPMDQAQVSGFLLRFFFQIIVNCV